MPRCTGCAACTPDLAPEAAARLHAFAAETVAACTRGHPLPEPPRVPALMERAGVFVTLMRHGRLRGCVGHVEADEPLAPLTGRMACAAARDDPRFPALRVAELEGLVVELSVLDAPVVGAASDVEPGRHGVIVTSGRRRGVLLPEVATEYGWNAEQLLGAVCSKAGVDARAWCRPETVIELFTTQHITAPVSDA